MNLDLTSDGSLKLLTRWGSIRVSLRPYGPAQSSAFCTIVICADSPGFQLHRLGNPYMSEGLQSISFRVIPRCSDGIGNITSAAAGRPQTRCITTYNRGSNFGWTDDIQARQGPALDAKCAQLELSIPFW